MPLDPSILNNIKGAAAPTLNVEDVQSAPSYGLSPAEQEAFNQFQSSKYPTSTGALDATDYYPGMNTPINVGNYSGSVIGSTTLFAPGGALVPLGMMDARDAAIQKAALQKAKDVEDFRAKLQTNAPKTKLAGIREDLTNDYFKHLDNSWQKALAENGGDAQKAAYALQNNIEFQRKTKSFHDLGQRGDDVISKLADIQDRMAKGEVVSPELAHSMKMVQESMNPRSQNFKNLSENIFKMDAEQELGATMNKLAKELTMQQDAASGVDINNPDYIKTLETTKKYFRPEQKQYLEEALNNIYAGSGIYSPERLKKAVNDFTSATQRTENVSVQQTNEAGKGVEDLDVKDMSKEPVSLLGMVQRAPFKGTKQVGAVNEKRLGNFTALDHMTFKKPVPVVIAANADVTDMSTGEKSKNTSVTNAVIGGVFNTYTYKGQMVDNQFASDHKLKSLIKVTPMVSVIFNKKDKKGNNIEVSGMVPLSEVENALKGKRNQNQKVIDEYKSRAVEHEKKIKSTEPVPVVESAPKENGSGTFYELQGQKLSESDIKNSKEWKDGKYTKIEDFLRDYK